MAIIYNLNDNKNIIKKSTIYEVQAIRKSGQNRHFYFGSFIISIICEHVPRLEMREFKKNGVAHLPIKREISTKLNFRHACPK